MTRRFFKHNCSKERLPPPGEKGLFEVESTLFALQTKAKGVGDCPRKRILSLVNGVGSKWSNLHL